MSERLQRIEIEFKRCSDQIDAIDNMMGNQVCVLGTQIMQLEKEIGELQQQLASSIANADKSSDVELMELQKKFAALENGLNDINEAANQLMEEREQRDLMISAVQEEIEMLKTTKADRERVDDQLADKVDWGMINRKVSHEQFDATCLDLTRGIEEALEKLSEQENLWHQALLGIQGDIGAKLDKGDLVPLRDFISDKLAVLQNKVKTLSKLKKEQEAAATKAALLRNVKCISCDNDVVMRKTMDPSMYAQAPVMPANKSMAPYLAYEIDRLRKQQKSLAISKNLNELETAINQEGHICNRYCGGSHTRTTPQQRVMRAGNFLQQWGPEVVPVAESEIKGTDGQYYKGEENLFTTNNLRRVTDTRASMVVAGDILSTREVPEKLSMLNKKDRKSVV